MHRGSFGAAEAPITFTLTGRTSSGSSRGEAREGPGAAGVVAAGWRAQKSALGAGMLAAGSGRSFRHRMLWEWVSSQANTRVKR